jgi:NAD(P)H dehydrogenase (quinone)
MTKISSIQQGSEVPDTDNHDRGGVGTVFITNASGEIGHRIVTQLLKTEYMQVRIGTAIVKKLMDHMVRKGAEIVDFSWDRHETFANALCGIETVIINIPFDRHWDKHFHAFLQACKDANVKHYVKISFYLSHVAGTRPMSFVKYHTNCDEMLIDMITSKEPHSSQCSYTILAASHFMSNPTKYYGLKLRNDNNQSTIVFSASKNRAINFISPNDVAEATVRVVLSPQDHSNRIYTLLGPTSMTSRYIALLLSKFLNQTTQCVDTHLTVLRSILVSKGTPSWLVNDRIAMQQVVASGIEESVTSVLHNDFEQICGHAPESFVEYWSNTDTMIPMEKEMFH